jgi:hypothetical protein
MDDLKIELHKNIFANIYELKFINQDYLITIDTISKSLLRDIVELHYINFINELITTPNIREKYNFIHNIEIAINPLEHVLINAYSSNKNVYKSSGIIDFLINIGYSQNVEMVKSKIAEYINNFAIEEEIIEF